MSPKKISIPTLDYFRIAFGIILTILGPILIYRSLKVPTWYGVLIGILFFLAGVYRMWLFYRAINNLKITSESKR
ncbi:MAG: hypothetical protein N3A72_02060 [bacterium]|nr:hypothetical protein [bacterium]